MANNRLLIRLKHTVFYISTDGTPESERELFKEEFETMTTIGYHPNVVNVLGLCDHEGIFLIIISSVGLYN